MSSKDFPTYHKQPFLLSIGEIENPFAVLQDFFKQYHLTDIRTDLLNMYRDAMNYKATDAYNHLGTYEFVSKLIEACSVILNNHKKEQNAQPVESPVLDDEEIDEEPEEDVLLGKPASIYESAHSDSMYVISKIFKNNTAQSLIEKLNNWKFVSLSAEFSVYNNSDHRCQFMQFYEDLILFIEIMAVIFIYNLTDDNVKNKFKIRNKTTLLTKEQIGHPKNVVTEFFGSYPMKYIKRELEDMLDAGIAFVHPWPDNFKEVQVLNIYRTTLCLIECADCLLKKYDNTLWYDSKMTEPIS
ncbi:hypothetical protein [Longitalea luteola]|uniref:hypothetical protein n=1 Tax=Longitalea luteola TaxID=2812563 RepID=UPI001A9798BB|nr:hypothetical protein [Longitalea luteola]